MRTADTAVKMTIWLEEGITVLIKRAAVYRVITAALLAEDQKIPKKTLYIIEGEKRSISGTLETVTQYPALIYCLTGAVWTMCETSAAFLNYRIKGLFP